MSAWLSSIPLISPSCHAISFKYACCFDGEFVFIYLKAKNEFQIHPPVPVHQYPGIPHHQIAHHDMQQMYRNQIQNTFPYINMSPPPLSPPILPVFLQPPIKQPLPYQAFVPSIKHLCHLLHLLKTILKWMLRWITMLSYCKALIRVMADSEIKDTIIPLLLTRNLPVVLSSLHHKTHQSTNMLSVFNMRQRTKDICKLNRNKNKNVP